MNARMENVDVLFQDRSKHLSLLVRQELGVLVSMIKRVLSLQTNLHKKHALQETPTTLD